MKLTDQDIKRFLLQMSKNDPQVLQRIRKIARQLHSQVDKKSAYMEQIESRFGALGLPTGSSSHLVRLIKAQDERTMQQLATQIGATGSK